MDLYTSAADVLDKFAQKQGSVKNLVFASQFKNVRQLYALVCESLKYQTVLQSIFQKCAELQKEEAFTQQPHLATILLYEYLLGKGLGRAGRIRSSILRHKREVNEACSALLQENGVESLSDLLSEQCQTLNKLAIPRYARVNLLKMTVEDAIQAFEEEGWVCKGKLDLHGFAEGVKSLEEDGFALDPLLPDLLIFPPGTDFHDHPAATSSSIVLQDRASCFPAHVLNPPQGATVLDCCAAPGNKTTHAASLLGNSGGIIAYERDAKRMSLLKQQLKNAGVTNTRTVHADFLSVNPHDPSLADVQYILVDPSCSGSGIINRMDHVEDKAASPSESTQRLQNLARFQISILKHALQFPSVKRVVYSTCSIHQEENESVVSEVAAQCQGQFSVNKIFPEWPHRGLGKNDIADHCLRMSPENDLTNGFFVACFSRVEADACDLQVNSVQSQRKRKQKDSEISVDKKKKKRMLLEENGPTGGDDISNPRTPCGHASSVATGGSSTPGHVTCAMTKAFSNGRAVSKTTGISETLSDLNATDQGESSDRPLKTKKKKKKKVEKENVTSSPGMTMESSQTATDFPDAVLNGQEEPPERPSKMKKKKRKVEKQVESLASSPSGITTGSAATSSGFSTSDPALNGNDKSTERASKAKRKKKKKKRKVEEEVENSVSSSRKKKKKQKR